MNSKINKTKKFKLLLIAEIVALFLFVLFFSPRKAFSELISGNYTVGEERYKVTMSRQLRNVISNFSYSMRTDVNSNIYANYVDENGNSFDFSTLTEDIEYDCNGNTCSIEYNKNSETMFNEKLGYINIKHGDVDATNLDVFLPRNFIYNSTTYSLKYYYSSFGCMSSLYFGKIYNVRLNGEDIGHNRYNLYPMAQYYTEKIEVDEDDDTLLFYWEHYYNKINVYAEDKTERNMFEEFSLELTPYNPYNSNGYSWRNAVSHHLQSGYTEYLVPGNYLLEVDFVINNYQFMIDVVDRENIYYDNIKLVKTPYDYNTYSLLPSDIENSTLYITVENLASSIIISNTTFSEVGGDKEFGYTITFDEKFNGNIFGMDYVDGVGKVYLKAGESCSISPPKIGLNYSIIPDEYDGFESYGGEFKGITEYGGTNNYYESYYRFSDDIDLYYYGKVVSLEDLVPGKSYVIFRATGGVGYMLTGKGNAKELTSYATTVGGKVLWPNSGDAYSNVLWTYSGTPDKALFESFGAVNSYLTVGKSTSGKRPVGNEVSYVKLETSSSPAMKVSNDGYYLALNSTKDKYSSSTSGSSLYFAEIDEDIFKVKFSGTNGGLHIYEGAVDKEYSVISGAEIVAPGTDSVKSPEKYNYVLDSWIDLYSGMVIEPGDTIEIDGDRVFYAKWVPKTYDVGVNTDTVSTVDTNDFINTEIYDYNEWFNVYSSIYNDNRWSLAPKGTASHTGTSLGLVFFDNAKNSKAGLLNSVDGRDKNNGSRQVDNGPSYYDGIVTQGISNGIIDYLFDKNESNYGVSYVGKGNHLYQYDEKTGFYYYDSRKNAASYNASKERFYVYDYKYGTSKSMAEGENGADFLPFNYMKKSDALNGKSLSSSNGATNYWFGLKSEIDFILTDDVGVADGNKAANGNDMILKFSGDDDVWIFIDDKLVLDLGGAHDIVYGEINFSTGVVIIAHNGALINTNSVGGIGFNQDEVSDTTKIIQTKLSGIKAGEHKATFYYVERGASRSNVSLYFNINDKYDEPGALVIKRNEESYASFEKHEFSLELSDTSVNGQFGELTFKDGVAKFKLLGGESIKVLNLPAGIKYKIKVSAPVEHTTEFNSNGVVYETRELLGKVIGGNTSEVQYKNLFDEYSGGNNDVVIPDTKDSILTYVIMLIASMFISLSVAISYLFIVKKQKLVDVIDVLRKY